MCHPHIAGITRPATQKAAPGNVSGAAFVWPKIHGIRTLYRLAYRVWYAAAIGHRVTEPCPNIAWETRCYSDTQFSRRFHRRYRVCGNSMPPSLLGWSDWLVESAISGSIASTSASRWSLILCVGAAFAPLRRQGTRSGRESPADSRPLFIVGGALPRYTGGTVDLGARSLSNCWRRS